MKKNNIIAYVIISTACVGTYIMGHIDGLKKGYLNGLKKGYKDGYIEGCEECTKMLREVLHEHESNKKKTTDK